VTTAPTHDVGVELPDWLPLAKQVFGDAAVAVFAVIEGCSDVLEPYQARILRDAYDAAPPISLEFTHHSLVIRLSTGYDVKFAVTELGCVSRAEPFVVVAPSSLASTR